MAKKKQGGGELSAASNARTHDAPDCSSLSVQFLPGDCEEKDSNGSRTWAAGSNGQALDAAGAGGARACRAFSFLLHRCWYGKELVALEVGFVLSLAALSWVGVEGFGILDADSS